MTPSIAFQFLGPCSKKNGSKQSKKCTFSNFADFSSKSGKCTKQMSTSPFWGDVVVKKWAEIAESAHIQVPKNGTFEFPYPKTETTFSRQYHLWGSCRHPGTWGAPLPRYSGNAERNFLWEVFPYFWRLDGWMMISTAGR